MVRMKTILESAEFFSRKLELVKRMIRFKHCCVILPETYIFSDNSFRSPLPLSKLTVKKIFRYIFGLIKYHGSIIIDLEKYLTEIAILQYAVAMCVTMMSAKIISINLALFS